MEHILYNAIQCPDGKVLESTHQHDYKTHTQEDGRLYMVDGGQFYLRRSGGGYKELSLYYGDPHEQIRSVYTWGSYGKCGTLPLTRIKLKDLEDEHLDALIDYTDSNRYPVYLPDLFKDEKRYREKINVTKI